MIILFVRVCEFLIWKIKKYYLLPNRQSYRILLQFPCLLSDNKIQKSSMYNEQSVRLSKHFTLSLMSKEVSKGAKIRNLYNQVPHLAQDTNGKVTNSLLGTTNESQEVSPYPAGDHKAHINRRAQRHSKHKTEKNIKLHKRSTALERSVKYFTGVLIPV